MISIITPTYNRAKLLLNTVESILKQTFSDWELIIVDDGSTDNTSEAIQPYLEDKRIQYIKKANSGASDTSNTGAFKAKGEFIVFLDSDDEALPNWLEEVNAHLDEKTGLIFVGAVRKFSNGTTKEELPYAFNFLGEKMFVKFTCGSLIIRRSLFVAIEGYDIKLKSNTQTDLGIRLLTYLKDKNLEKKTINKCLVQINIHEGPRIRSNWSYVSEGSQQLLEKHYDFFLSNKDMKYISDTYSVIAFSNYKLKNRQKSLKFLFKAIQYNPANVKNYIKIFQYSFL